MVRFERGCELPPHTRHLDYTTRYMNKYHEQVAVIGDYADRLMNTVVTKVITAEGCCLQFRNEAYDFVVRAGVTPSKEVVYDVKDILDCCRMYNTAAGKDMLSMGKCGTLYKMAPPGRGVCGKKVIRHEKCLTHLSKARTGTAIGTMIGWLNGTVYPFMKDWVDTEGGGVDVWLLDHKEPIAVEQKLEDDFCLVPEPGCTVTETTVQVDIPGKQHTETRPSWSWFGNVQLDPVEFPVPPVVPEGATLSTEDGKLALVRFLMQYQNQINSVCTAANAALQQAIDLILKK